MTKAAIAGHRPERLPNLNLVFDELASAFSKLGVDHVIQGMAAGADLISSEVAYQLEIPFECARPWAGHSPRIADREAYANALRRATGIHVVHPSVQYPGPWVYQKRNEFMVNRSDILIAVWGGQENGGTWNGIKYAVKMKRPIWCIDPMGDSDSDWYAES